MSTPLLLSATRASWSCPAEHGTEWDRHPKMKAIRNEVLRRDNYTCQGCGWRSERWQEIHSRNGDHRDFREKNLETLCPFCHQVFHLPTAASTCGGVIAWLPEISQRDLNIMCFPMFVAMKNPKHKWSGQASQMFSMLNGHADFMAQKFSTSDPGILAQILVKLPPEKYANRESMIGSLRLLPRPSRFQVAIDYWEAAHFSSPSPESWDEMLPSDFSLTPFLTDFSRSS